MKTRKLIKALFVCSLMLAGTLASAEEFKKEFYKAWSIESVSDLEIDNRFGEVRVSNENDSVSIDVKITVDGNNPSRMNELLDQIDVVFRKSGGAVKAQTVISGKLKGQNNLSIDYIVNVPPDKDLKISNRYGNTILGELTGNGQFYIKYGNFTAYDLATPENGNLNLSLAYGNANIGAASYIDVDVSYSPITIEELKRMKISSKYSTINVEEGGDIKAESRYDKYNCEELNSFVANTKYSHVRISELAKSLIIESGYGGVKVEEVGADFEEIRITNSYGQISLGLDDSHYLLDASCDYCGISYPEDEFTGDRIKENNSRSVKGKIGEGSGGKVYVRSRYGDIRLK